MTTDEAKARINKLRQLLNDIQDELDESQSLCEQAEDQIHEHHDLQRIVTDLEQTPTLGRITQLGLNLQHL